MKTTTIKHLGMEGTGRTKSEAKQDAISKIEAATAGSYTPTVIVSGVWAALVYRDLSGWGYKLIATADEGIRAGAVFAACYDSREKAHRDARRHVGQLSLPQWGAGVFSPDDVPSVVENEEDRRELHRYAAWQRAYGFCASVLGLKDQAAHSWACNYCHEFFTYESTAHAEAKYRPVVAA